ncbi:hypothetical protein Acr_06g0006940 [Actinidia rufa]|uniref:Uncharacterized protein n=1 Tax=Actinidia rufa TaxID=165716 RepID=A0A7J0EQJ5_9ERIC|nr:hypothetical protein Acr_06g0006940 [Actinidia rufa]
MDVERAPKRRRKIGASDLSRPRVNTCRKVVPQAAMHQEGITRASMHQPPASTCAHLPASVHTLATRVSTSSHLATSVPPQETSAYELWINLEEMHQVKTSQNKVLLMRRLVSLKVQRRTTVAEHMSEFQNLVNQFANVDLQFEDEKQALLLLICEGLVRMANNTANRVVGKGTVLFRMADKRSVTLTEGDLLSDMGPVVLARRMDKKTNSCTEVRKASAGVLGGSVVVPRGSEVWAGGEIVEVQLTWMSPSLVAKPKPGWLKWSAHIASTDGKPCSGQTPDIAWENFQKKGFPCIKLWHGKRFSCNIDGVRQKCITQNSLLDQQEKEKMHILNTDPGSVVLCFGQNEPVVPDSFHNDQSGCDVFVAVLADMGQSISRSETLGLPVGVHAMHQSSNCHAGNSDSKFEPCTRLPLFPEKRESAFLGRKRDGNAILKRKNRAPKEDGSLSEQIGHESNTPKPNRTKSSFIGVKSRTNRSSRELPKSGEVDREGELLRAASLLSVAAMVRENEAAMVRENEGLGGCDGERE